MVFITTPVGVLPLETRTQLAFHHRQKQRRQRLRKRITTSEKAQIMEQPSTIINQLPLICVTMIVLPSYNCIHVIMVQLC